MIIFIILIEFVTILFMSFLPQGMWDLSSQATDATGTLCVRRQSPNQWTTREVPVGFLYKILRRSHNKKRNEKERKGELWISKRKKGEETRVLSWVISKLFPSSSLTHHHALLLTVSRTTSVPFCHPFREASIHKPRKSHWWDPVSQLRGVLPHRGGNWGVYVGGEQGDLRPWAINQAQRFGFPTAWPSDAPPLQKPAC